MMELIQFPGRPFCTVQRQVLEFAGARFQSTNLPGGERWRVRKLSRQRYYGVPILRDGRAVVFETGDDSQILTPYLDPKFQLGLFPPGLEGVQSLLWRCIEPEVEQPGFKLPDIRRREPVPKAGQWAFVRHKKRKFGRGCLERWLEQQNALPQSRPCVRDRPTRRTQTRARDWQ